MMSAPAKSTEGYTFAARSAPREDPGDAPAIDELQDLARLIEAWRAGRGMSRRQLLARIGGLNDKTHSRILKRQDDLVPGNHLATYRAAWAECQSYDAREQAEEILPDIAATEMIVQALSSLKQQRGGSVERFVLIEAESGAGKTTGLKAAAAALTDVIIVSAHESWTARPSLALRELLMAVGYPAADIPEGFASRHDALTRWLHGRKPVMLVVDEAQHMDVRLINVLKDIINRTECWIAIATMASLWKKIQASRWSEVKQLLHNRLHLRLALPAPTADEIEAYIITNARVTIPPDKKGQGEWAAACDAVARNARANGLWSFVRKTTRAARRAAHPKPPQAAEITTCAASILQNTTDGS